MAVHQKKTGTLAHQAPVQSAIGTWAAVASQGFGYGHPETVIMPLVVSAVLYHPSPPSTGAGAGVGVGNVSVDKVGTGPVAVYVGSNKASATKPIDVGGHKP
jgi:hypothetical protein